MTLLVAQPPMKTLVPVWIVDSDNPALARMTRRPVLIAIDELELTMRGQVVDMSMGHALLRPESQFYLCKDIYVEIAFRFGATRYTLSGIAQRSSADQCFRMDFDSVARKTIQGMGELLKAGGLIDNTDPLIAPVAEEAKAVEVKPVVEPGRRVYHDGPPEGIERRGCPRFDVEAYVRLTLVEEGRRVESLMIDLSLSGCRLYFKAPHGFSQGLQVEVQFIADGLPLRLAAVVQVCHFQQVVGLRFVNVGARMQDRLEWLISEVDAGRAIAPEKS